MERGAIVADGVRKEYDETVALDGVSLEVEEGEVFGLVGPNGAGKTTLIRCLTGTADPTNGEVSLLGENPRSIDKSRLGHIPQDFTPPELLSGRELLEYYAGLYPDSRDIDEVLREVGMEENADKRYKDLSGGQQRRICVGASLVNEPDVFFLDEPTTGIDPAGRKDIWDLVERLSEEGATVFLTTHYMEEAHELSDRVGLLSQGELVEVGEPSELVKEYGSESRLEIEVVDGDVSGLEKEMEFEKRGDILVFEGVDPRDIGGIIEKIEDEGIEFDEFTWKDPDLEDVYLRLTGDDFRTSERIGGIKENESEEVKQ